MPSFDELVQFISDASVWAYAIIFVIALLDAFFPVVPSETAVITAGVVASTGELSLALIIPLAAAGAFIGDNFTYWFGRRFGTQLVERRRGGRLDRRVDWARGQLDKRGGQLIALGRFIPGGRTAVNLTAGSVRYPWRRFLFFDAIAAVVWASYGALLGYFGGEAFEESPWKGLLFALLLAFTAAFAIEAGRWLHHRRQAAKAAGSSETPS